MGLDLRELLHFVCLAGELAAVLIMYSIYRLVRRSNEANRASNLQLLEALNTNNQLLAASLKDSPRASAAPPRPPPTDFPGPPRRRYD